MRNPASIGGRAAAQGIDYEERVAAWAFAQMLASGDLQRFGAVPEWRPTAVWMQAPVAAGDVVIEHSGAGAIYIQAKHRKATVHMTARPDGLLVEVLSQFSQLFVAPAQPNPSPGANPWSRGFDAARDRFALVVSTSAGAGLAQRTAAVLAALREPGGWAQAAARFNAAELKLVDTLRQAATLALQSAGARQPAVEPFLSCVSVVALDVDNAAAGAAEARLVLESSVLTVSSRPRGAAAWDILLQAAREANRGGHRLVVADLSTRLQAAGCSLRAPRAYEKSIQQLQQITEKNLLRLRRYAELRVGADDAIEIPRECMPALRGSLDLNRVVIGRPGAGKSGVIYQVCKALQRGRRDVVLLLADDLQASSEKPLREVLGLDADLAEVLAAWPGGKRAHLVIDALDAARDAKIAHQLRAAMGAVIADNTRWRVVASVRRFDLKHSPETRDLFPGDPVDGYGDAEFAGTAHFDVPELSDGELAYAGQQSRAVRTLVASARKFPVTHALLKQPFNLSLACELLRAGVPVPEIVPFETNTVLLDRFWDRRVTDAQPQGAQREAVLATMVNGLVQRLAMRMKDDRAADRAIVAELAGRYVLDPGAFGDGEIRFSHHLLHDYAVSRLLFRSHDAAELVETLRARPELSLYARQSLLLHFDYLWDGQKSRERFWATALALLNSPLPLVARIFTTECAVMNLAAWSDFAPLLKRIAAGEEPAKAMLRFCVSGFLDTEDPDQLKRVGPAWIDLAVHLAEKWPDFHWQVHLLLFKLVPDRGKADPAIEARANLAARLLAKLLLAKQRPEDRMGPDFLTALRTMCQTGGAAPEETEGVLRPFLERKFAEEFGDRIYWVLADKIKYLIPVRPELVRDFYVAVFANESTNEGMEQLGTSKIVPMQVKRSDNYGMARHRLHSDFPAFFTDAPVIATTAVMRFIPAYRAREHPTREKRDVRKKFRFRNKDCVLIEDLSSIWASDTSARVDDAVALLRAARNGWVNLGERRKVALLDQILDVVAAEAELAVIWRAVFEAGKRAPETLGLRLVPLLSEPAILVSFDLHYLVAALLELVFPKLKKAERAKIERAVVALPLIRRKQDDGTMRSDDLWRGLYLNQMPLSLMVTAEAKALRASLEAAKSLRKNVPPYRSWSSTGKMEWSDYVPTLKDVDLKTPEHVAAKEWEIKLQAFGRTDGKKHTAEAIDTFWPTLVGAYEFTVKNPPAGIHPDVSQLIWSRVVEGAEQIVRSGVMPKESERRAFLREILLRGALDPKPEIEADTETSFARIPSWGSPSPRIDAAQALIVWPRETRASDDELRAAIRRLAADPHPAVRFQIAGACNTLYDVDRPFMWELIKERAPQEVNAGVWTGLLGAIDRIAPGHQDEAADLFFDYLQRFPRPDEANRDPADTAVAGLSDLFIRFGHARATDYVMKMVADPVRHAHYLKLLCHNFRDTLAVGLRPTDTEFQRNLHRRGLEFFLTLVRNGRIVLDAFMAQGDKAPAPKREEVREVVQLLDGVNMQVFFASGAHDGKRPSAEEPAPPTMEFWRETKPIIDELVTLPSTHIAYHLSETLEFLITADPPEIFRCIVRVVANTKADGFAHEHLAVGVITRIVERYLADYAELFRAHEDLRAGLLQVLDTFADVGWPEARRLIRSLSSLYR
ncbi:MAG: hypothetical protein Q8N18_18480 [Opitutaceae bacterium]|nr:hypothetical protein [Opitutaceae bacterium]